MTNVMLGQFLHFKIPQFYNPPPPSTKIWGRVRQVEQWLSRRQFIDYFSATGEMAETPFSGNDSLLGLRITVSCVIIGS